MSFDEKFVVICLSVRGVGILCFIKWYYDIVFWGYVFGNWVVFLVIVYFCL